MELRILKLDVYINYYNEEIISFTIPDSKYSLDIQIEQLYNACDIMLLI